jgi:hypothetical protein
MFGHASNPKLVDVVADLLGVEDIKIYGDQLFSKSVPVCTGLWLGWRACLGHRMPQ